LIFLRNQAEIDYVEDENRDAVQMLTIHRSKGLQFDVVYVISQNERNKPSPTLFDIFSVTAERVNRDADEVQRVLYVAMTRARNHLTITGSRTLEGKKKTYSWNSAVKKAIESGVGAATSDSNTLASHEYSDFATHKELQPVLSYNAVRLYEICPLQYRFSNFDRLETVRIGGMQFGVNMHRVIEQLLRMTKSEKVPKSTDVATLIDKYWRDLPTRPNDENVMFREAGKKQLILFLENFIGTVKPTELAGIEESFSMSIAGTRITGRFDLRLFRNGSSQIIDFKTGDEADYSGQLNFYAACLREMSGTTPFGVGIYYLKSGKFNMLAPTNLDAQIERVKSVAEKIKLRNFTPSPGKHCSDCAFTSICEFSFQRKKHLKANF
jgi:DNA helicase-2/ATP-dependent DNA helicase PcrA